MAYTKRVGYGVKLGVDITGGTSFTPLGSVIDGFKVTGFEVDDIDTAVLSDHYRTHAPGQIEPGTVAVTVGYDPADTTGTSGILTGMVKNGTIANFQIDYDGTDKESFLAFIKAIGEEVQKQKLVTLEVTLQKSGNPGFTGDV